MSNIPSKGDLKNNQESQYEEQRQDKIKTDITKYTDDIVAAMNKGKDSLTVQLSFPEPEAQTQIIADFAKQGWTVVFRGARSGGNISWS